MIICVCAGGQLLAQAREVTAGQMAGFSVASTPMIWFGVSDCINAPLFTKMRRPSATNALNTGLIDDRDLDILFLEAGDAKNRLRIVAQELLGSASRRIASFCSWASAAIGATTRAIAVAIAVIWWFSEGGQAQQHRAVFIDWRRV